MTIDPKQFCQLELKTSSIDLSLVFLHEVFGWKAVPINLHNYTLIDVPEDLTFGISLSAHQEGASCAQAIPYFRCDASLQDVVAQIQAAHGTILEGPVHVPGYGEVLKFQDPGGLTFGLFRQKSGKAKTENPPP